ncbi:cupin [Picosynechococcus sp. PCC 7003]|uniref:1,2-dihydroxy-3-keto-5-methylthiopentene dioxygenase n=1 Tax=Picosynechococcus sp. PCC 7003 TaxID=374981 RepID=UPI0008105997|nr:cupin [Picosynechococcus sp. PCC 7003]ANV83416.1 cupin [Picosynechococcus sp. PCC 7003]
MTTLYQTESKQTLTDTATIKDFLKGHGIWFDQWETPAQLAQDASQEEILAAYAEVLDPFMVANGYQSADVVNIHSGIENYPAIREKFLAEHTHSEDEVRFFVAGQGLFWFNLDGTAVFNVCCEAGDLISVPQGTKHWFDAGPVPNVKAIRIFSDTAGWTPHYTGSQVEQQYRDITL